MLDLETKIFLQPKIMSHQTMMENHNWRFYIGPFIRKLSKFTNTEWKIERITFFHINSQFSQTSLRIGYKDKQLLNLSSSFVYEWLVSNQYIKIHIRVSNEGTLYILPLQELIEEVIIKKYSIEQIYNEFLYTRYLSYLKC